MDLKKEDNVRDVALNKRKCKQEGNKVCNVTLCLENLSPAFGSTVLFNNSLKRLKAARNTFILCVLFLNT